MIKYMTVERIDRTKSKNGERIFNLPFSIQTFENFKNFKLPEYKKLIILAEQYILAKSIDDMMYQDNIELSKFLITLKHEAQSALSTMQKDIDQDIYNSYKSGVESLLKDFTVTPALINMFENTHLYPKEDRILPKSFYKPFLEITQGKFNKVQITYPNALILYPELQNDIVVFHPKTGTCVYKKDIPNKSLNKQLNYLLHFNWNESNWLGLVGILESFCINNVTPLKSNRSVSHFLKALVSQNTSSMINYSEVKYQLLQLLKDGVSSIYKTPYLDSIVYILENLNYDKDILDAFTNPSPTGRNIMHLSKVRELDFLKKMVLLRATEAAENTNDEDEENNTENDPSSIAENTDDEKDFDNTDADDPFAQENDSMDMDTEDTSSDDAFGSDDSFGDDDSLGEDNSKEKPKENNVDVPDSPYALALKIVTSETLDDYFIRNQTISLINAIIVNPPSTLSAEDLKFLKIWVTQWINFYPIETTKQLVSNLSVFLEDTSNH